MSAQGTEAFDSSGMDPTAPRPLCAVTEKPQ